VAIIPSGRMPPPAESRIAPPYQFPIEIPADLPPGPYRFTALGAITPGHPVWSDPITVDVERPDLPLTLTTDPAGPLTMYIGERVVLDVIGTYADGSTVNLTNSSQISLVSQSPDTVTINSAALATAVAPGTTQIVINGTLTVPVTVEAPVEIAPATATITASQTRQFTAWSTTHPENPGIAWSINPAGLGSIDTTGLYTAPDSVLSQQTVTITATSVADSTLSASAVVTLSPAAFINVSPAWSVVYSGQSEQLTASASNAGTLSWSINPAGLGTIGSAGLYTAPSLIPSLQQVTVTATSAANSALSGSTLFGCRRNPFNSSFLHSARRCRRAVPPP